MFCYFFSWKGYCLNLNNIVTILYFWHFLLFFFVHVCGSFKDQITPGKLPKFVCKILVLCDIIVIITLVVALCVSIHIFPVNDVSDL